MSKERVIQILKDMKRFRSINDSDIDLLHDSLINRVTNLPHEAPEVVELKKQLEEAEAVIRVAMGAHQIGLEAHNYYTNKMRKAGIIQ